VSQVVMWWCYMYIGGNGLTFVRRREDIWITGCNAVGFYVHRCEWFIFCTEEGHLCQWM